MTTAACSIRRAIARCSTAFGRLDRREVERAWSEVTRIESELAQARPELAAAERDREYLAHASAEIEALAPEEGEETKLAESAPRCRPGSRRANRSRGSTSCSADRKARCRCFGRRLGGSSAGRQTIRCLAEALASLDRALIEASEAEDRIARAADALAFDPARLEQVEARLFDIRGLARKHRVEPDALAALGEQMRAQLAAIDAGSEHIDELDR